MIRRCPVASAHSRLANLRATSTPAPSSERNGFPTPRTDIRGGFADLLVSWFSRRSGLSDVFQVPGNVLLSSIINPKILVQGGMFPTLIGHVNAIKFTTGHALSTVDATIHVIFQHILFGSPVQDKEFNGIRRAVLDA